MVVFDFDKTLTDTDTLFGFYRHANKNDLIFKFKHFLYLAFAVGFKLRLWNNDRLKGLGVRLFLRGKTRVEIERAAKEYAKFIKLNGIYHDNYQAIPAEKRLVISASFEEYLIPLLGSQGVVGSLLAFKNDCVSGLQRNMYGKAKSQYLHNRGISNLDMVYTDSFSDRPLMEMAEQVVLIKNGMAERRK